MYGKIFDSMYDGTISANWQGLVTFQQFIVLCDSDGVVDMTPPAIARRTGIPIEIIAEGIAFLEQPDPYSRSPEFEGRRIVRLDEHRPWGWFIVNHKKYKHLQDPDHVREQNRIRKQRQRDKEKESQNVTDGHGPSLHTDTDTNKDICANAIAHFDAFWKAYPTKRDKKKSRDIWKRRKLDKQASVIIADVKTRIATDEQWKKGYIPYPTTYLNGDRWEDETAPVSTYGARSL